MDSPGPAMAGMFGPEARLGPAHRSCERALTEVVLRPVPWLVHLSC